MDLVERGYASQQKTSHFDSLDLTERYEVYILLVQGSDFLMSA